MREPATGARGLASGRAATSRVNALYPARRAGCPSGARGNEVAVNWNFAEAHRLRPSARPSTRSSTARKLKLTIVGIVLSPEYIYATRPRRHDAGRPPLRRAVDAGGGAGAALRSRRRLQLGQPAPAARRQRERPSSRRSTMRWSPMAAPAPTAARTSSPTPSSTANWSSSRAWPRSSRRSSWRSRPSSST